MIDNSISTYFAVVADGDIPENLGSRSDIHIVAYVRHSTVTCPDDDSNMNSQVVANPGFIIDDNSAKMGNAEAFSAGIRMNMHPIFIFQPI